MKDIKLLLRAIPWFWNSPLFYSLDKSKISGSPVLNLLFYRSIFPWENLKWSYWKSMRPKLKYSKIQWLAGKLDFLAVYDIKWRYFEWRLQILKVLISVFQVKYIYIYDLGLSNELLIIIIAQGATKLWPVKVQTLFY